MLLCPLSVIHLHWFISLMMWIFADLLNYLHFTHFQYLANLASTFCRNISHDFYWWQSHSHESDCRLVCSHASASNVTGCSEWNLVPFLFYTWKQQMMLKWLASGHNSALRQMSVLPACCSCKCALTDESAIMINQKKYIIVWSISFTAVECFFEYIRINCRMCIISDVTKHTRLY